MKKALLQLLLLFTVIGSQAETPLERLIRQAGKKAPFTQVSVMNQQAGKSNIAEEYVSEYALYELNQPQQQKLLQDKPQNISLSVSLNGKTYSLQLTKAELHTQDFSVKTSDGGTFQHVSTGLHYRGIVQNETHSLAAISFFDNEVTGIFATEAEGNFVVGKLGNAASNTLVVYNDKNMKMANPFHCGLEDDNLKSKLPNHRDARAGEGAICKNVRMYYEADYKLYTNKGSTIVGATNFIDGMFNSVSTVYLNENITVSISQIYVWTSPDPFPINRSDTALEVFTDLRGTNFNGDLAQLLSTNNSGLGGIAWLDAFCGAYPESYANIDNIYKAFPTTSWNIIVMCHEAGHNFGSPHTHSCNWSGGPIDWCGPTADSKYIEGSCSPGPIPTKGTVMSYCHLLGYVGINLALGFGPLPGDLIRDRTLNAQCLGYTVPFVAKLVVDTNRACAGDTIVVAADPADETIYRYTWYNGDNLASNNSTYVLFGRGTGAYHCEISDSNGCVVYSDTLALQFIKPDARINPSGSVSACSGQTVAISSVATSPAYVWTSGETTQSIQVGPGTYKLTVTDATGCTASASKTVSYCTGIDNVNFEQALLLYPNPTANELILQSTAFLKTVADISLYDVTGKWIAVNYKQDGDKITIHTSPLATGVYVVNVNINGTRANKRFVKE